MKTYLEAQHARQRVVVEKLRRDLERARQRGCNTDKAERLLREAEINAGWLAMQLANAGVAAEARQPHGCGR
jgi:hypothetical protein